LLRRRLAVSLEPLNRFGFRNNRKNLNGLLVHIVKDPNIVNPQPVLGLIESPETLDTTLTRLGRIMPQMSLDLVSHRRSFVGTQSFFILRSLGSEHDLAAHSG